MFVRSWAARRLAFPVALCGLAAALPAQDHSAHAAHTAAAPAAALPTEVGQDASAAIAEVVALLTADPATDWSRVNIEALRQHLRDMHLVTLSATVVSRPVPGGAEFDVQGAGEVAGAVRRMAHAHAAATRGELPFVVTVSDLPAATRVRIVAPTAGDVRTEARIRGLGFIGWVASGGHHQAHHVAIARGQMGHAH
jgi:hypothetical protein